MSAKEMFEELGFNTCKETETRQPNGKLHHKEIKYYINGETVNDLYFGYVITFILDDDNHNISKHYAHSVRIRGCADDGLVDMPLLQAINQQCKELGWLE